MIGGTAVKLSNASPSLDTRDTPKDENKDGYVIGMSDELVGAGANTSPVIAQSNPTYGIDVIGANGDVLHGFSSDSTSVTFDEINFCDSFTNSALTSVATMTSSTTITTIDTTYNGPETDYDELDSIAPLIVRQKPAPIPYPNPFPITYTYHNNVRLN